MNFNDQESSKGYFERLGDHLAFMTSANILIDEMANTFGNLIFQSTQLNKVFTQNRQRIEEMQTAISDAVPGVTRLGGSIKDVTNIIGEVAIASRRNVIANTESVEKLFAASEVLGDQISSKLLVENFANIGITFEKVGKNLEESISYVQSIGGNAREVMSDVLDNTEQLNKFNFENGVQGLTKMAAKASLLRVDMNQVFTLAEKALSPENAVEIASAFQRLGVMSGTLVDPFSLMNESINNPKGLLDSITQMTKQYTYFDEKTRSFRISPQGMLTLREISNETNISYETLTKMGLAASELDSRLSQISPTIKFANEEDKMYLANIASMNEQGEYTVNIKDEKGRDQNKRLVDITQQEMDKLIEEQKKGEKPLEEIARNQLTVSQNLENDVKAIREAILGGLVSAPQIIGAGEKVSEFITTTGGEISKSGLGDTKTFRDFSEGSIDILTDLVTGLFSENKTSGEVFSSFLDSGTALFEQMGNNFQSGGKDLLDNISGELKNKGDFDFITEILDGLKLNDPKIQDARFEQYIEQSNEKFNEYINYQNTQQNDFKTFSLKDSGFKGVDQYKYEFKDVLEKITKGEEDNKSLVEYIKENELGLKNISTNFYDEMSSLATDLTKKIKEDENKLNDIRKNIQSLNENQKYGVFTENKTINNFKETSNFIEGTNTKTEPINSGRIYGNQSLTQVIQHKVDFGKITVDVNLTGAANQFDTDTQKLILDKVFNDVRFKELITSVDSMKENSMTQTGNLNSSVN